MQLKMKRTMEETKSTKKITIIAEAAIGDGSGSGSGYGSGDGSGYGSGYGAG